MTVFKTALRIIALIIIMVIVGYVLFFVNGKEQTATHIVKTPAVNNGELTKVEEVPVVVHTIQEQASTSPQVTVEYPQFPTLSTTFNAAVEKSVTDRINQFRQEAAENYKARKATAPADQFISPSDFSFIAKWEPTQINPHHVSFIIRFDSYTGGANENQELETYNYSLSKKASIELAELFPNSSNLLEQISTIATKKLSDHMTKTSESDVPLQPYAEGVEPKIENFQNFTFTENILTIYFPKYSVGAGAFGEMHVEIPLRDIK